MGHDELALVTRRYVALVNPARLRIFVSVSALLLVACSGSSGTKSPATEEGLKEALRTSTDAVYSGNANKGYRYLSSDCQDKLSLSEFSGYLMFGKAFLEGFSGEDMGNLRVGEIEVRNLTGDRAETRHEVVTSDGLTFSSLDEGSWTEWIYEDGGWKTTDCEEFDASGMSSDGGSIDLFSEPDCALLQDGKAVPDDFTDDSNGGFDLSCENGDEIDFGYTTSCFESGREYAVNSSGFAFVDEAVYRRGDVRGCLPACGELVPGVPVPAEFNDESDAGFNLNCETPGGRTSYSYEWSCFESSRAYVQGEDGYAFVDDRVYVDGEPPVC